LISPTPSTATPFSTFFTSSLSKSCIGEGALLFLHPGDLAGVLPRGRSPWPELSGHPHLSLVGALAPVWCRDAHLWGSLGPAATADECAATRSAEPPCMPMSYP
jgi:hypothetical protein